LVSSSAITEIIALLLYMEFAWYCLIGIIMIKIFAYHVTMTTCTKSTLKFPSLGEGAKGII